MLETIKNNISNNILNNISFDQYYIRYVHDVQDSNIASEVKFAIRNNNIDVNMIDKLINLTIDRW